MKNLTVEMIKKELKNRGFKEITKEDINNWAIVFVLEELLKKLNV